MEKKFVPRPYLSDAINLNIMTALEKLKEIPESELARVYCEMNHWEIPKELSDVWLGSWDLDCDRTTQVFQDMRDFLRPLMGYIQDTIGHKAWLRYANKDRMTPEEFEVWWKANH